LVFQIKGPKWLPLQGKIVHGGTFNGNEEESKKEETLTVGETIPRKHHGFSLASPEKHLLRGFSVPAASMRL